MMKGALLVLALMVTRELIFQTSEAEACPVFYGVFSTLILGSKTLLNTTLDFVAATDEEKAALGKIQDCYNEAGIDDKVLDLLLMASINLSTGCIKHAVSWVVNSIF
ncbi:major allergen I polypeptide chain 2-like isoform X2 [Bubalus bubalis]|uniref:major allergen I polypeptide chain 2-like isoform X2 n=1 Tax=Bubalus bubalis TaxID=89462 RepID=UPI001E1B99D1|nr:major allergen I polypeptide chain 2-like isoform X2 [Bubalus bubalis]